MIASIDPTDGSNLGETLKNIGDVSSTESQAVEVAQDPKAHPIITFALALSRFRLLRLLPDSLRTEATVAELARKVVIRVTRSLYETHGKLDEKIPSDQLQDVIVVQSDATASEFVAGQQPDKVLAKV